MTSNDLQKQFIKMKFNRDEQSLLHRFKKNQYSLFDLPELGTKYTQMVTIQPSKYDLYS